MSAVDDALTRHAVAAAQWHRDERPVEAAAVQAQAQRCLEALAAAHAGTLPAPGAAPLALGQAELLIAEADVLFDLDRLAREAMVQARACIALLHDAAAPSAGPVLPARAYRVSGVCLSMAGEPALAMAQFRAGLAQIDQPAHRPMRVCMPGCA